MSLRAYFRLFTQIQLMPIMENGEEILVGGQAVLEGVMMRAPHSYCVAVRKPDGEIVTEEAPLARMSEKYKIFKYPVFRGVGTLWQAMTLGLRALRFSSNVALQDPQPGRGQPAAKRNPRLGHCRQPGFHVRHVHFHVQVRAALAGDQAAETVSGAGRAACRSTWPMA